jgi:NAD+ kinase
MKVAIYGSQVKDTDCVQGVLERLEKNKAEIFVYEPFLNHIRQKINVNKNIKTFKNSDDLNHTADCLLSLGGDGTFLETITLVRDSGIPLLGINTGRLGFLANVSKGEIDTTIDLLVKHKFTLDKRSLLRLETKNKLFGDVNYALNEVTILKKDSSTMITIHTYVNGEFLNSYWADGLIISTPTGSTAYSLSCGGPIILADSESFVITPIAPHNLNVRPVIVSDKSVIKLKVEGRSTHHLISLDSRTETIDSSIELVVKKGAFKINMIRLEDQHFFHTIRNKLLWGIDKRN